VDRQSQPSGRRCHSWELQDQPFTFYRQFATASIFSTDLPNQHVLDRFSAACDRARMKISTKHTEVLCLPTNRKQCILQVSDNTLQQLEKFKYLGVVAYLSVTEGGARILMHGLVKLTQFCVSLVALWSQNALWSPVFEPKVVWE